MLLLALAYAAQYLMFTLVCLQMSRFTTGRFSGPSLATLPLLGLNFIAWVILLAGVSALQHRCSKNQEVVNADVPVGSIYPASRCSNVYRFQWWIVILQLFTLVGECIATVMPTTAKT